MAKIKEIGTRIKLLREQKGLSQKEFAEALGCPQTTVSGWEGSLKKIPRKELIEAIAHILNVSESYLLGVRQEKHFEIPCIGGLRNEYLIKNEKEKNSIEVTEKEYNPVRFAIKILDNSFEPLILENDICIMDNMLPEENDIVLIKLNEKYLLKKWKENKNRIALVDIKVGFPNAILFVVMKKNGSGTQFFIEGKRLIYQGKAVALRRNLQK